MAKNHIDKKELIITILVLLGGVALTVTSFCIYYLVNPQSTAVLAAICIVDFLYNLFTTSMLFKFVMDSDKWLLKGFLLSVGYTVAFIIVAVGIIVFGNLFEILNRNNDITLIGLLKNNIKGIICYSIFTGPSIFIVLALVILCLAYGC